MLSLARTYVLNNYSRGMFVRAAISFTNKFQKCNIVSTLLAELRASEHACKVIVHYWTPCMRGCNYRVYRHACYIGVFGNF